MSDRKEKKINTKEKKKKGEEMLASQMPSNYGVSVFIVSL